MKQSRIMTRHWLVSHTTNLTVSLTIQVAPEMTLTNVQHTVQGININMDNCTILFVFTDM